jgi:hypothetical protein
MKEFEDQLISLAVEQVNEIKKLLGHIRAKDGATECKKAFVTIYAMHMSFMCGNNEDKIRQTTNDIISVIKKLR